MKPTNTFLMDNVLSLARDLGLIETFPSRLNAESTNQLSSASNQNFDYFVVIDFESTCWNDKNKNLSWQHLPEIIEFPAVLIDLTTGTIENEFHHYVMPVENPTLSEFCKQLTGITQDQVDAGIPLPTCLMLFSQWITKICSQKNISFHKKTTSRKKSCTFVTWSNWDLAVCLQNEVKRKQIRRPEVLCQWIDLRAVYKGFYNRKPQGLRGALAELGISFRGREHSGIVDARNTAFLAFRMISDGCVMNITGCIQAAAQQQAKRRSEQSLRKQKQEEKSPIIHENTLKRQPLATIVQALSNTPIKPKRPKIPAEIDDTSVLKSMSAKAGSPAVVSTDKAQMATPTSKQLHTPCRRLRTPASCKRTPPLCRCSRRAVLKVVNSPGPNQGRSFFSCSNYKKSLGISSKRAGCGYFMWC